MYYVYECVATVSTIYRSSWRVREMSWMTLTLPCYLFTLCGCNFLTAYITLKEGDHLVSSVNVSVPSLIMITTIHV